VINMHRLLPPLLTLVWILALTGPISAQESASFKLREHSFNASGRPDHGTVAQSASFRVSLDAIGDSVSLTGPSSASFQVDLGFVAAYPPPREVTGLLFTDAETLVWNPEKSTGAYNLYRRLIADLPGLDYGLCKEPDIADETTTDDDPLAIGEGFFYLVTAKNLIDEEGTKGFDSDHFERANPTPCP